MRYGIGPHPGSGVGDFFACSSKPKFYPEFYADLLTKTAGLSEVYATRDILCAFARESWFKLDFYKNPEKMKLICNSSNDYESPIPWTVLMRNFVQENAKLFTTYNKMHTFLAKPENVTKKDLWVGYKRAAVTVHAQAQKDGASQYKTSGKKRSSAGAPAPRRKRSSVGRAVAPAADETDAEDSEDDEGPPGAAAGAAPAPPRAVRRKRLAQKAAVAPADDDDEDPPGAAPATPRAAAGAATAAGGGYAPTIIEEKFISMLKAPFEAFACLDHASTKITGFLAVPLSDREASAAADRACMDWGVFIRFTLAPKEVSVGAHQVYQTSKFRQLIYESYEHAMSNKSVPVQKKSPTGDAMLDQYSIPVECLEVFGTCAGFIHAAKGTDTTIARDIADGVRAFRALPALQVFSDYLNALHEFPDAKNVDEIRARDKRFLDMPDGYPRRQYHSHLKDELLGLLDKCGWHERKKAMMTNDGFDEYFQLYAQIVPDWPVADQKLYMDDRNHILSGIELFKTRKIEELTQFEAQHGRLDELCAKNKMSYMMKLHESTYSLYKATRKHFSKDQPAAAAAADDDEVAVLEALEDDEKTRFADFFADQLVAIPGAKNSRDAYMPFAEDMAQNVLRCRPQPIAVLTVETLVFDYDFSGVQCVAIRQALCQSMRQVIRRHNKGNNFIAQVLEILDGNLAASKQPRPPSSGSKKRVVVQTPSPSPPPQDRGGAGNQAASPAVEPPPRDMSRSVMIIEPRAKSTRAKSAALIYDADTGVGRVANGGKRP